jgi:hypothetical protein
MTQPVTGLSRSNVGKDDDYDYVTLYGHTEDKINDMRVWFTKSSFLFHVASYRNVLFKVVPALN